MSGTKYNTIQQHEPLRTPANWNAQEKKLIAQLEEILDDIYRRFGRLKTSDLGEELRDTIKESSDGVSELRTEISQTDENVRLLAEKTDTKARTYAQDSAPTGDDLTEGDLWIDTNDSNKLYRYNGNAWADCQDGHLDGRVTQAELDISGVDASVRIAAQAIDFIEDGTTAVPHVKSSTVEVDSNGIEIKSTGYIDIQGTGNLTLSGGGNVVLTGGDLTLSGGSVSISAAQGQQYIQLDSGGIIINGGQLVITAGNFTLDDVGNVTIQNASVSGILLSNGYEVLTNNDIVISSTAPTNPETGMVWIKPGTGQSGQGSTQSYSQRVASTKSFTYWTQASAMASAGGGSSTATGPYRYTLKVPYKITTDSPALVQRTLHAVLTGNNGTISMSGTLSTGEGLHTKTLTADSTTDWIASGATVNLRMYLTVPSTSSVDPDNYHFVPPGEITLTCVAQGDSAASVEDWVSADVYVYQ